MILPIEDLSVFLQMLESEDTPDTVPLFVNQRQFVDKGVQIGEIVIQYTYDTDMLVQYISRDGIDPVRVPNNAFITGLQFYGDKDLALKLSNDFKTQNEKQNMQLKTELEKAKKMLTSKGFKILVPSLWIG